MGYCSKHKRRFGWTCPACEEAWTYTGRTHLLEFFDAGVRNERKTCNDVHQRAA